MHRKIIEPALRALDEERAVYFFGLVDHVEEDERFEDVANLAFLILRESLDVMPPLLGYAEVADRLYSFIRSNRSTLLQRIHSREFTFNPAYLKPLVDIFMKDISDLCWSRVQSGEITTDGGEVHRFSWPYSDDVQFPYEPMEETDEEADDAEGPV